MASNIMRKHFLRNCITFELEGLILKFIAALLLVLLAGSAAGLQYDLAGTVIRVIDDGILDINVTDSEDFAGVVQVLLVNPVQSPQALLNRELQFNILGRDILGRPVVEQATDEIYWQTGKCPCAG
jgi:hypothetical protein